jgi:hypothetical protein
MTDLPTLGKSLPCYNYQMQITEQIHNLTRFYMDTWWESDSEFPPFQRSYSRSDLDRNDRELDRVSRQVMKELKQMPADAGEREALRARLLVEIKPFVGQTLGLGEEQLQLVLRRGFIDVSAQFVAEAHRYDPSLTDADIYQASRNVMSMNFIQLLLSLPVELTPAVFAYSLLYPYSDNILDDPAIPANEKRSFGEWFHSVLMDKDTAPRNDRERRIRDLIAMVEIQFPRKKYPAVYESMLGIHAAQSRSQVHLRASFSPYEADVLGLSFEKGGASVLGDGYLVAGELSDWQRKFMFGYGCFTQMMDDVEDIRSDLNAGIATVFSQSAGKWSLDGVTNRLFHFGESVFSQMERFEGEDAATLRSLVWTCIQPALIGSLIRSHRYYTRGYLQNLQKHFPFHFRAVERQEKSLRRNNISVVRLVEAAGYQPAMDGRGAFAVPPPEGAHI